VADHDSHKKPAARAGGWPIKQNRPRVRGRLFQFEYVSGILQKTISLVNVGKIGIASAITPLSAGSPAGG
jgi:hypothetical protein